jgi:glutathione synthase/RimK-type ligase-like ATP-grasp enzyme
MNQPLKVGLLVGRERSFPDALIAEVNRRQAAVSAEYVQLGGVAIDDLLAYRVIVDRISHDVTFYQPVLKLAALQGVYVINNPFWRVADDKFFGTALAHRLGIAVPRTVVLPNHSYPADVSSESLRNLIYPLDWERIVEYVGLPAVLKPHWGGGWKQVHVVDSLDDLWRAYDSTGRLVMILQEFIQWETYIRCLCIGQDKILPVRWDPTRPHFERYAGSREPLPPDLHARVVADARTINRALGYDMNTVEFAVRDGIPYAIDFMNSAPDFDITSLTVVYFDWVVNAMADQVIDRALAPASQPPLQWDAYLRGSP